MKIRRMSFLLCAALAISVSRRVHTHYVVDKDSSSSNRNRNRNLRKDKEYITKYEHVAVAVDGDDDVEVERKENTHTRRDVGSWLKSGEDVEVQADVNIDLNVYTGVEKDNKIKEKDKDKKRSESYNLDNLYYHKGRKDKSDIFKNITLCEDKEKNKITKENEKLKQKKDKNWEEKKPEGNPNQKENFTKEYFSALDSFDVKQNASLLQERKAEFKKKKKKRTHKQNRKGDLTYPIAANDIYPLNWKFGINSILHNKKGKNIGNDENKKAKIKLVRDDGHLIQNISSALKQRNRNLELFKKMKNMKSVDQIYFNQLKNKNNIMYYNNNENIKKETVDIFKEPEEKKMHIFNILPFYPKNFFTLNNTLKKNSETDAQKENKKEITSNQSIINKKLLKNLKKIELNERSKVEDETDSRKKENFKKKQKNNDIDYQHLQSVFKSVVKLYIDVTYPDLEMLWQNNAPVQLTGSGFVIEGNLILTNAHNIAYSTRVLVRKHGDSMKYEGRVLHVSHEADMAILVVSDSTFFKNITPLEFGPLPSLLDDVIAVGYPMGGDKLSITKGIISRIDVQTYAHSNYQLLLTQIDAPLNPGNSGGPAIVNNRVIGICFQSFKVSSNISYIIPSTVIKHFLIDIYKSGKYSGFTFLGIKFEPLENAHARYLMGISFFEKQKIVKPNQGVLVTEIDPVQMEIGKKKFEDCAFLQKYRYKVFIDRTKEKHVDENADADADADIDASVNAVTKKKVEDAKETNEDGKNVQRERDCYGIQLNDVILEIDGHEINNDGTVKLRNDESVGLQYVFNDKYINDFCMVTIIRKKKLKTVIVKMKYINYLLPQHDWDKRNKYFVYAGLVFTILTRNLFSENESENSEINKLINYNYFKKRENDEIVGNITVLNLNHLVSLIENGSTNSFMDTNTSNCRFNEKINGIASGNINDYTCTNETNPYVTHTHMSFDDKNTDLIKIVILASNGNTVPIVLSKKEVQQEQRNIFKTYRIHEDRFLY